MPVPRMRFDDVLLREQSRAAMSTRLPSWTYGSQQSSPPLLQKSPSEEGHALLLEDLSPDLHEVDIVTQFLHPPPWPASHPLALSRAMSVKEGIGLGYERIGPSPFPSIKSARIATSADTGLSRGWGIARFSTEADRNRALVEMQGIVLTPSSGTSPGRPLRVSAMDTKTASPILGHSADEDSGLASLSFESAHSGRSYQQSGNREDRATPYGRRDPSSTASAAHLSMAAGRYTTPSPMEIAMQSAQTPLPSTWGIATLPGFPTIPATGASGPVDVGLRSGVALGSSYGGPASLGGTHFTLGPATLPSPSSALDPNNTTVFVGGLSSLISEETLKTFFSPFGAIAYVKIPPGKGCGFVSFLRKVDAERAIERMQGFPIGGSRIRLSWGRSQGEKNQQLAQMQISQLANWASLDGTYSQDSLTPQQRTFPRSTETFSSARMNGMASHDGRMGEYASSDSATRDFLNRYHGYANGHGRDGDTHRLAADAFAQRRPAYPTDHDSSLSVPYSDSGAYTHASVARRGSGEDDMAALFDRMGLAGRSVSQGAAASDLWRPASGADLRCYQTSLSPGETRSTYGSQANGRSPQPSAASAKTSPFLFKSPWQEYPVSSFQKPDRCRDAFQLSPEDHTGGYFGRSASGSSAWPDQSISGSSFRSDATPDSLTGSGAASFSPFSPLVKAEKVLDGQ